ncbi:class I SAM-dependent methyltransferase [Microlunatus panaciterrae]|uniref:Methyltransferase small domain-containing protein n=1 Tax=Microlunatus panaciterrae TaxID=400768 RepID=A0ABS2RKZ6_9ACTN|nr:methyltransferase [Microlunatus panaciterrae]MBM7799242.1 hypothetical protein [Microlunatus panaciterrae]
MLSDQVCAGLRQAFVEADYTVDAVVELIGEPAHRALGRNSTLPARTVLADDHGVLATLTMMWLLQQPVSRADLDQALPGLVRPLLDAGLLSAVGDQIRAVIDIRPYASDDGAGGWIVSDLSPGLDGDRSPIRPDFVLGVSSASTTLAQMSIRRPVARALDLGAGCGVQSLHLARHADTVVATDLNPRAVEHARLTAKINNVDLDLRLGSLFEPVEGELFDLIVSNPPYVMSPPSTDSSRLVYREGSHRGDALVEQVVRDGARHLAPGGSCQVLGNWAHRRGQDWTERLAGWVAGTGCDAHVVQRETLDPYEYIELWLADAGLTGAPDYPRRYVEWLDYFGALGVEAVGMGWISLHRTDRESPRVRIEDWPYPVEQPIGPAFGRREAAVDLEAGLDDAAVLQTAWVLADDVVQESIGRPGEPDPQHIVLRQQRGFRRAVEADTALAGVLGACDGDLRLDRIIAVVADLLDADQADLRRSLLPRIRELVVDGLLSP